MGGGDDDDSRFKIQQTVFVVLLFGFVQVFTVNKSSLVCVFMYKGCKHEINAKNQTIDL